MRHGRICEPEEHRTEPGVHLGYWFWSLPGGLAVEEVGQATALRWGEHFPSTHPSLHSFPCPLLSPTWLHPPPIPNTAVKVLCSLDPAPLSNVPNAHPGSLFGVVYSLG